MCEFVFFDSELSIKQLPVCRTDKIPLGTKGRTSILSVESSVPWVASFPVSRRKLTGLECCVTLLPSRWLHPLAPLKRLSPVDLPSANGFDKPFAASKFEKTEYRKSDRPLVALCEKSAAFFIPKIKRHRNTELMEYIFSFAQSPASRPSHGNHPHQRLFVSGGTPLNF